MKTVAITGFHNEQEFLEVAKILEFTKYQFAFPILEILNRIEFEKTAIVSPANEQRKLLLMDVNEVQADKIFTYNEIFNIG